MGVHLLFLLLLRSRREHGKLSVSREQRIILSSGQLVRELRGERILNKREVSLRAAGSYRNSGLL